MTHDELINLLKGAELQEFCITDQYVEEMLKKSDIEIHAEIANINSFGDL